MSKIEEFEEIKAWIKARELVKEIYRITSVGKFAKDWSLKDQIRRAVVSIMSNIAEGFSRQSDKEFIRFLYIAKGSTAEVQSQLYVASDLGYVNEGEFNKLYNEADKIAKLTSGFIRYLKDSDP